MDSALESCEKIEDSKFYKEKSGNYEYDMAPNRTRNL